LLILIGSITMVVSPWTTSGTNTHTTYTSYTTSSSTLAGASPSPVQKTPTSPAEVPTVLPPTPMPLTPFPTFLQVQIDALQARNHFLYHGNIELPEIALTFDDGPNPSYTPQVLAVLKRYGIKATFFDVGYLVQDYPDLVRQEYAAGNMIENHSWSHPHLNLMSSEGILAQLNNTSAIIQQTIGVRPTFFRPPYGDFSASVLDQASTLGLTTVLWNDEAHDWELPGVEVIAARILHLAGNGVIVLLHDAGGNRSQTVAALPIIIETLQKQGYRFVTLQQLLDDMHK
ncbi:MAG: polysaccharide deacetylase family protein, partial [Chloroflexota bacterium]|nr:polysaccharide deacetylase family protein [Chloroflexota bacterium]